MALALEELSANLALWLFCYETGFRWGRFGQEKSPAVNVNNAAPTETEIRVENGKQSSHIVYSMDAPLRNLDYLTSEITKKVQPLMDNLNFGQVKQDQPGTSDD